MTNPWPYLHGLAAARGLDLYLPTGGGSVVICAVRTREPLLSIVNAAEHDDPTDGAIRAACEAAIREMRP